MITSDLILRQKSALNGFAYQFFSHSDEVIGEFTFATFAQGKNARLRVHTPGSRAGDIRLQLGESEAFVCFEHLRRGWNNDIRYTLELDRARNVDTLAVADVLFESSRRLPRILLRSPMAAEVLGAESLFKKCFRIVDATGTDLGIIREPKAFSMKRELAVSLPNADPLLPAFLSVVVICVRY